jgi:hypothetical protein
MSSEIELYTSQLDKLPPLNDEEFNDSLNHLDFEIPIDYIEFMKIFNGGEGPIGENGYLILWPIDELIQNNIDYEVQSFAPGFFVFAKDAADTAFAFEKATGKIYEFGLMANLMTDPPKSCGLDFKNFLEYLYQL